MTRENTRGHVPRQLSKWILRTARQAERTLPLPWQRRVLPRQRRARLHSATAPPAPGAVWRERRVRLAPPRRLRRRRSAQKRPHLCAFCVQGASHSALLSRILAQSFRACDVLGAFVTCQLLVQSQKRLAQRGARLTVVRRRGAKDTWQVGSEVQRDL